MRISRQHSLGTQEARQRVDQIAADLGDRFNLRSHWQDDELRFTGTGIAGRIVVADNNVDVNVNLGLSLMLMEGSIRSAIEDTMSSHLT